MNFMDTPAKNVDFSGKFHHSLRSVRYTHLLLLEKKKCKERDDYLPKHVVLWKGLTAAATFDVVGVKKHNRFDEGVKKKMARCKKEEE